MKSIKYWVIKTGAKSHILDYIKLFDVANIGDDVYVDYTEELYPTIYANDNKVLQKGKNALDQMLIGWEALGLVKKEINRYIMLCPFSDIDSIVQYSKISLTKKSDVDRVQSYRNSKMINALLQSNYITFSDLKAAGVYQAKGELSFEKIKKEISFYEIELAKDKELLKKIKEILND